MREAGATRIGWGLWNEEKYLTREGGTERAGRPGLWVSVPRNSTLYKSFLMCLFIVVLALMNALLLLLLTGSDF